MALLKILSQQNFPSTFVAFYPIMKKHFFKKYEKIIERLDKKITECPEPTVESVRIYNMNKVIINYTKLKKDIENLYLFLTPQKLN